MGTSHNKKNKFDTLQKLYKRYNMIEKYENFVTAHIEAAAECIPIKLRTK